MGNALGAQTLGNALRRGRGRDSTAPTLVSATVDVAGTTLTLVFSEAVTGVATADFALSGSHALSNVGGSGTTWTMTCGQVNQGETLTLNYTGTAVKDLANNQMATFSGTAVTNNSTFAVAPAGTEIATNQSAAAASLAITVPAVAQNKRVVVCVGYEPGGGASVSSITDSRGNTYTAVDTGSVASIGVAIWSANMATALQLNDVITINMSNGTSRLTGHVSRLDNVLTAAVVDKVAHATGSGTSPSSGATAATTQAAEIAIGAIAAAGASTFTAGSGWTKFATQPAQTITLNVEYKVLAATGAQTADGTLGTSQTWAAVVGTFKGA
jgi:hypothetical protein